MNTSLLSTLQTPFMVNAFIAGFLISITAGIIGYFVIARKTAFAAHALAHIGLPGATGAALLGLPVSLGLGVFALAGALTIGAMGKKASKREVATGSILAFAMGLGLFFARMSSAANAQMQSILFGSILTVSPSQLLIIAGVDVVLLVVLPIIYRPLLFSTVDENVAQAKGIPIQAMNMIFMAMMAAVITISVQAVGTLLIFALVVTPAAAAQVFARSPLTSMLWASLICLVSLWGGLFIAAAVPVPPSFAIVTISTVIWAVSQSLARSLRKEI